MGRIIHAVLGVACALAGLVSLPYVGLAIHDALDALRGKSHDGPAWAPVLFLAILGILSLGAFVMAFRFLRYAFTRKSAN